MKANEYEYKEKIHIIIDQVESLQRLKRIYSYANRICNIEKEEKEGEN